jgi:hypothetical protein
MKIEIRSWLSGAVLASVEAGSVRLALEVSVTAGADLGSADLRGANLWGANLRGANLRGANLRDADLRDADLCRANLGGADLVGVDLGSADLWGANLWGANLRGANLRGANLRDADLGSADLRGSDLRDAYIVCANIRGANLGGANIGGGIDAKAAFQVGSVDNWPVLLWSTSVGLRVAVGCHFFSLEEAEAYWRGKSHRTHLYMLVTEGWKTLVQLAGWDGTEAEP